MLCLAVTTLISQALIETSNEKAKAEEEEEDKPPTPKPRGLWQLYTYVYQMHTEKPEKIRPPPFKKDRKKPMVVRKGSEEARNPAFNKTTNQTKTNKQTTTETSTPIYQACQLGKPKKDENYSLKPTSGQKLKTTAQVSLSPHLCVCQACQLGKPKKEENYSLMPTSEPSCLGPARLHPQIPISI